MSTRETEIPSPGRLATLSLAHPRCTLALAGAAFIVAVMMGAPVAGLLSAGGFVDPHSESARAADALAAASGVNADHNVVALVQPGTPIASAAGRAEVDRVHRMLARDSAVGMVIDASTDPALVSRDGRSTYLVAALHSLPTKQEKDVATRLENAVAGDPHVRRGGYLIANNHVQSQVSSDLGRAELLAAIVLVPLMIVV